MSIRTKGVAGEMVLTEDVSTVRRKLVAGKALEWALATSGIAKFTADEGVDSVALRLKAFEAEAGLAQRVAVALGIEEEAPKKKAAAPRPPVVAEPAAEEDVKGFGPTSVDVALGGRD